MTRIIDPNEMDVLIQSINNGHVVSFPTETVYGLAVKFGDENALDQLYEVKNRDYSKAITLMLSRIEDIHQYAYVNERILKVAYAFMPGQITLILKKKDTISDKMTNGLTTIGIRIPDNQFVLELIDKVGPLFVTSANISGHHDTTNEQEVLEQLEGRIDVIVKGNSSSNIASTVVLLDDDVKVLREGIISEQEIKEVFHS